MNSKTSPPKRVKHFKTKISKANMAVESQFPKKLAQKLDADEIARDIIFVKRTDEIINDDENTRERPFFDFF